MSRRSLTAGELVRNALLLVLALLSLFPVYFSLVNSLKSPVQYAENLLNLPATLHPENYVLAWEQVKGPLFNSVIVTLSSVLATVIFAALSAYALALIDFPGRRLLFGLIFALLLVPDFLTLIPLYVQIKSLILPSNYLAIILPTVAAGQPFAILVLYAAFRAMPRDMLEAARLDGAGHWALLRSIVLPLSLPILVSVSIIRLVPVWNDFLLPSLVLDEVHRTVPVALVGFQGGGAATGSTPNYGALMASYVLSALPLVVLFLFLMRSYVQGVTSGGVKA